MSAGGEDRYGSGSDMPRHWEPTGASGSPSPRHSPTTAPTLQEWVAGSRQRSTAQYGVACMAQCSTALHFAQRNMAQHGAAQDAWQDAAQHGMAQLSTVQHAWHSSADRRSACNNQLGSGRSLAAQPGLPHAVSRVNEVAKAHVSSGCKRAVVLQAADLGAYCCGTAE